MRAEVVPSLVRSTCVAIVLALLAVPAVQPTGVLVNECNSDITITQLPAVGQVGQTSQVTLRVSSTNARDNGNNPIPQTFNVATYRGDCMVPPGIPCDPNMPAGVMFQGNVGGTCNGMGGTAVVPDPMGNGVVDFDFVPPLVLNPNPLPTPFPVSCTVTFDVTYTAAGTYASQANLMGECQMGAFNSDTTVTTVVDAVPTMGEVALAILALVLLAGSWLILRRRSVSAAG